MKWWIWTTLAGLIIGAALHFSAPADATPAQDQALTDAMAAVGVQINQDAIPAAYIVCAEAWAGTDLDAIAHNIAVGNPTWGIERASAFVGNAVAIYCPPAGVRDKRIYA